MHPSGDEGEQSSGWLPVARGGLPPLAETIVQIVAVLLVLGMLLGISLLSWVLLIDLIRL